MNGSRWLNVILFVGCIFITNISFSQIPKNSVEFTIGTGKVVRNYPDFPALNEPAYNAGLNFSKHFDGYKPWHRYYNFPRMGISFNGGSLGNKEVLGSYVGIMSEMTFEKRLGKSWFWAPRLSLGAAWFSNPFDEEKNVENVVIGSSFTFFAGAEFLLGRKLTDYMDVIAKAGILHASNSHFKLPNVGLNLPLASVGIRYKWQGKAEGNSAEVDTLQLVTSKKMRLHARVALGVNEFGSATKPVNGPKYPVYLTSVYFSRMFSPVNKITAGAEFWYSKGIYDFIVSQEFYDDNRHTKSCAAALVFGHEFLMGHFGLLTTAGIYLYNPFYNDRQDQNKLTGFKNQLKSIIPARLGIQYYLKNTNFSDKNNLFVGIYIKTNFGQADFLESGIGYVF